MYINSWSREGKKVYYTIIGDEFLGSAVVGWLYISGFPLIIEKVLLGGARVKVDARLRETDL